MIPWWCLPIGIGAGVVLGFALFYGFEHWTYTGWTRWRRSP